MMLLTSHNFILVICVLLLTLLQQDVQAFNMQTTASLRRIATLRTKSYARESPRMVVY